MPIPLPKALLSLALCVSAGLTAAETQPIHYYDMTFLNAMNLADPAGAHEAWDTAHLVASIQGIVNRDAPRLFVRFMPHPDDFWFEYLTTGEGWLAGREVVNVTSIDELLATFAPAFKGLVVYDERVAATSNLASTIAGVEDRLCLRFDQAPDSLCQRVLQSGHPFASDVKYLMDEDGTPRFTGVGEIPGTQLPSTGSAKCDAHLWAKHHYLDPGRCSDKYMAFYIDAFWLKNPTESGFSNATLTNHDFFISQRAFFFDLHVWEEEAPVDDPHQKPGTDVKTLHKLLHSMYQRADGNIIHLGGFTPWAWKYTNHHQAGSKHGGVDTEWKYARIISTYNGIMDADALGYSGMANASFYQHFPLQEHYPQNPKPTLESLREKGFLQPDGAVAPHGYLCFYMGDYDAAAWLNYHVPLWWQDEAHGDTLCTWAFNPNLDRRAPHAMHYARTHQTPNDWFMFGDSGAGYLNPGGLNAPRASGLPDGWEPWIAHNLDYGKQYDLSITGFIIDGQTEGMGERGMDAYQQFSPDGIVGQRIPPQGVHNGVMPYTRMKLDLHGDPESAGNKLASMAALNLPKFMFIRTILKSPSWHRDTMRAAREANPALRFVDPYAFFLLLKQHHENQATQKKTDWAEEATFTAPDTHAGAMPIKVADGAFSKSEVNGEAVLLQPKPSGHAYLYFELADNFAGRFQASAGHKAEVRLRLFDSAPGKLGIQYDAHDNSAYKDGGTRELKGTGDWVEVTFTLPNALFSHGQNGGADLRLVNHGLELAVQRITVRAPQ